MLEEDLWQKYYPIHVDSKNLLQIHEGVFKGIIGQGLAKSEPIGQLSKELNQLNMTPSYF